MSTYILVADIKRACVDGAPRKRLLAEVVALDSPSARKLPQDLGSDRTGRVFARARLGRQGPKGVVSAGADNESDPRIVAAVRFAARIGRRIDLERRRLARTGHHRCAALPRAAARAAVEADACDRAT
jgi:hypothetical protein